MQRFQILRSRDVSVGLLLLLLIAPRSSQRQSVVRLEEFHRRRVKFVQFEVAFAPKRETETFDVSAVVLKTAPEDVLRGGGRDEKGSRFS